MQNSKLHLSYLAPYHKAVCLDTRTFLVKTSCFFQKHRKLARLDWCPWMFLPEIPKSSLAQFELLWECDVETWEVMGRLLSLVAKSEIIRSASALCKLHPMVERSGLLTSLKLATKTGMNFPIGIVQCWAESLFFAGRCVASVVFLRICKSG